jgi:HPt (histidine-containing phosphotransfer) domain-containing protein
MNRKAGDRSKFLLPRDRQGSRLDLEHLRRYTADDRMLEVELLSLFKVQARLQSQLIAMAKLPSDYRRALHTLKGAALAIGANAVATTAAELESMALGTQSDARRRLIDRLTEEIAAVEAEIAALIG